MAKAISAKKLGNLQGSVGCASACTLPQVTREARQERGEQGTLVCNPRASSHPTVDTKILVVQGITGHVAGHARQNIICLAKNDAVWGTGATPHDDGSLPYRIDARYDDGVDTYQSPISRKVETLTVRRITWDAPTGKLILDEVITHEYRACRGGRWRELWKNRYPKE